jgi:hypothetical protein
MIIGGVAGAGATNGSEAPENARSASTGASSAPLRPPDGTNPEKPVTPEPAGVSVYSVLPRLYTGKLRTILDLIQESTIHE